MSDETKPEKPQIPNLELNKETLEELTERQVEEAKGGLRYTPTETRGYTCSCAGDDC